MKAARISGLGEISGTQTKVETEVAESGRCVYRGQRLVSQSPSWPGLSRRPQHGASRIEVAGAGPVHDPRKHDTWFKLGKTALPYHIDAWASCFLRAASRAKSFQRLAIAPHRDSDHRHHERRDRPQLGENVGRMVTLEEHPAHDPHGVGGGKNFADPLRPRWHATEREHEAGQHE